MASLRERLIDRLGGVTDSVASDRSHEAYRSGYQDSGEDEPVSGTTVKYGYRRQTTGGLRDFTLIEPDQVREIIWTLWQSNPLVKRSSQIKRDYILGQGVSPQTEDGKLQNILDKFWSVNQLSARQKEFTLQLFLFGEQILPAFVRKSDGRVKLGYIDPGEVETVITHPENSLEKWAVVVKARAPEDKPWAENQEVRVFRVIREEEKSGGSLSDLVKGFMSSGTDYSNGNSNGSQENRGALWDPEHSNRMDPEDDVVPVGDPTKLDVFADKLHGVADAVRPSNKGKLVTADQAVLEEWERTMLEYYSLAEYTGSCFFFNVNSVSNNERGYSDFLQVADWVDQHDVTLFTLADREQLASFFSWDVTLTNADDKKVKQRSKEIGARPPRRGSVNVHNDAELWKMEHPDVQATNSIETARALQLQILGGLGYPEHWFGKGDETNRATAQAQGDPTWKTLEHDQGVIKAMFLMILHFVKDQAEIAGEWKATRDPEEEGGVQDHEIDVPMPEMTVKDPSMISSTLSNLSSAMTVAEEQSWQTTDDSRKLWAKGVSELGVEIDISKLPDPEEQQATDEETGDTEQGFGQEKKSWAAKHGPSVLLPDEENAETAETFEELSEDNRSEMLATLLERSGYSESLITQFERESNHHEE